VAIADKTKSSGRQYSEGDARTLQAVRAAASSSTNSASLDVEARDSRLDKQPTGFTAADVIETSIRNAKTTGGKETAVGKQKVPASLSARKPMVGIAQA
jgi:hypothetical protein